MMYRSCSDLANSRSLLPLKNGELCLIEIQGLEQNDKLSLFAGAPGLVALLFFARCFWLARAA